MHFTKLKSVVVLLCMLLLTACATQTQTAAITQSDANAWRIDGVFSYHDKAQAFNAGYIWQNFGSKYQVHVLGPLGAWSAELSGDTHHALIETSDGKKFTATNAEQLMQHNLGWSIPVQDLMHWLWAMPNPNLPGSISKNAKNQIVRIQQAGWTVNYSDYVTYQDKTVPNRIVLTQPDKRITVVIQHRA